MGSSVDSSRRLFSLNMPCLLGRTDVSWKPWSFSLLFSLLIEMSPEGFHLGQWLLTFGGWKCLCLMGATHIFSLTVGQVVFLSAAGCRPGPHWYCFSPHPPTSPTSQPSNCFLFLAATLTDEVSVFFLLHVTAKPRPRMLSLPMASPDLAHSVRAEGKPQSLPDYGGQIKSGSDMTTQKMHEMF